MLRDFESDRQRLFTRRALLLGGLQAGIFGVLASRMYYLQVTEGMRYALLAEDNRINHRLLAAPRGLILDRFGQKLAVNEQNFRLMLVPEQVGNIDAMLKNISTFVPLDERDLRRIRRDIQRNRSFAPLTIADNLTWDQAATVELRLPDLEGVSIDVGQIRHYPFGEATAHILGYVSAVNEDELKADADPLLSVPGVQIGKTGIEKLNDKQLRGVVGAADLEVNAFGRTIREIARREGTPGHTIRLTLDIELQKYAQQRLMTERSAAAVVIDAQTGAVYAMASHPTFDANAFSQGISQAKWQELTRDETVPLTNKVIGGLYAPGSTFKVAVGLASLEGNHTTPAHTVSCTGAIDLGNHRFHCWKRGGHGTLDMVGALRESCDVYFYDLARRVGIDGIAAMARRLGIGAATGLDMPGERNGLMPDRLWKEATHHENWQPGDTLNVSIGQGDVQTTPLQLAVMLARIVNGGYAVVPHLTREIEGVAEENTIVHELGFDRANLAVIAAGMNAVVNDRRGTGFTSRIETEGQQMGGKTGTSQVRRISMAERASGVVRNEDRPWLYRDHALFIGYAPVQDPRYVVAVMVEHGGGGSKAAAPIARDILIEAQRLNPSVERTTPLPAVEFIPPVPGAIPVAAPADPDESD